MKVDKESDAREGLLNARTIHSVARRSTEES